MTLTPEERREIGEAVIRGRWTSSTLVETILDRVDDVLAERQKSAL